MSDLRVNRCPVAPEKARFAVSLAHGGVPHPCPCGFFGDSRRTCVCSQPQIRRYLARISGPLLDRIDLHVEVPRLSTTELMARGMGESSTAVRTRVATARERQTQRYAGDGPGCNAQLSATGLRAHCQMDTDASDLLRNAINQLSLSART